MILAKLNIIIFSVFSFVILCLFNNVHAAEKHFLTVDELLNNGYSQLTEAQLTYLLKESKIEVRDIETEAVSLSTRTNADASNTANRKSEDIKTDKPLYFLDARLIARAPPLEGEPDFKVKGSKLIATDGVRTYHIRFYEKQGKIFGARDIDHGNVFFQIIVR